MAEITYATTPRSIQRGQVDTLLKHQKSHNMHEAELLPISRGYDFGCYCHKSRNPRGTGTDPDSAAININRNPDRNTRGTNRHPDAPSLGKSAVVKVTCHVQTSRNTRPQRTHDSLCTDKPKVHHYNLNYTMQSHHSGVPIQTDTMDTKVFQSWLDQLQSRLASVDLATGLPSGSPKPNRRNACVWHEKRRQRNGNYNKGWVHRWIGVAIITCNPSMVGAKLGAQIGDPDHFTLCPDMKQRGKATRSRWKLRTTATVRGSRRLCLVTWPHLIPTLPYQPVRLKGAL